MSRRPAVTALLAAAAVSAATVAGFGLLVQPAAHASDPITICIPVITNCPTPTPTPTTGTSAPTTGTSAPTTGTSAPTTGTSAPTTGSSAPTSGTSAPASGSPSPTSTASTTAATTAPPAAKPKAFVNITLSGLRIRQQGKTLVVRFTVTNTGTLPVGAYDITARASGYPTRTWFSNLPVGQPIQVTTSWPIRSHHATVKVVVTGDPRHQVKESDESDNVLQGSKRLR